MHEDLLREIASEYLVPFFSGASIASIASPSDTYHQLVAIRDPQSIHFKVNKRDRYRLTITRPQPFITSASPVIPEINVISAFVSVLGEMENELTTTLKDDLLSTFQRRVVARALYGGKYEQSILAGIDLMARWGTRLYEGAPISAAIGFRLTSTQGELAFSDLAGSDVAAVLSNGFDTLLAFNFDGQFLGHESLEQGRELPSFCPMRQSQLAHWTTGKHTRLALSLNRLGEILVVRQEQILFARRSGRWHFLTHVPVISQMNVPRDVALRTAIYETSIDASFARTGACIGVVGGKNANKWPDVVQVQDHLKTGTSAKVVALRAVVKGQLFHKLDRRTRQELSAIDGALVLSHQGEIHAVGAILKISGGSTGGGRLAAAKALGKLGLGVKVSQDGGITGFRDMEHEPVFKVMA